MNPPKSLRVLAILNLVFGGMGIFGTATSYAVLHAPLMANNPAVKMMNAQSDYATWMRLAIPLGLLGVLMLLTSGVGLLKAREWARKLAVGYGIYAIIISLISIAMNYRFVVAPLLEQSRNTQGAEAAGAIGGAIGGVIGGVFALAYPIILLVFMTRPRIVAACTGTPPPIPAA